MTSYVYNWAMFASSNANVNGQPANSSRYLIGNIPDGTSNTVGISERYAHLTKANYSGLWSHHAQGAYWQPNSDRWAPVFYYNGWGGYTNAPEYGFKAPQADYYVPNSGHSTSVLAMMMDGSVKNVSSGVSAATWDIVCVPDDGLVVPSNW